MEKFYSLILNLSRNRYSIIEALIMVVFFTLGFSLLAQEEKTIETQWSSNEPGKCSIILKLYSDKSWNAECCGPGSCIEGEGSYAEGAHSISFKVKKSVKTNPDKKDDFYVKLFKSSCEWTEDKTRLDFLELLTCGTTFLFKESSKVREGTEIESKHGILIALGQKNGKISDDAKFRNTPSIKSKTNKCKIEIAMDSFGMDGVIPKNSSVKLLARTKDKMKVKNWENYWYFIETFSSVGDKNCKENTGWVFGEFVVE